ncbi:hypothetical protein CEXT_164041 [Caerostris extrusa]|uniref:Uncharacterized protein n=1 Tax=Caerostris extrusa TaxID=172846 RepID=A0AAV4NQ29_CAEEX|nr:hypothetical protein CEXT_164041 [Caerostris extrusa]
MSGREKHMNLGYVGIRANNISSRACIRARANKNYVILFFKGIPILSPEHSPKKQNTSSPVEQPAINKSKHMEIDGTSYPPRPKSPNKDGFVTPPKHLK